MRIMKLFGGKALAVALACAMVPASAVIPSSTPLVGAIAGVSEANAQSHRGYYRGGRNYHRRNRGYRGGRNYYRGGRHYGNRGYYRRGNNGGAAVAGAIAGLAAGAIIAGAASQPRYVERRYAPVRGYGPAAWSRDWYNYCASRYRSFDPRSGTFQPYHGPRQLCR